MNLVRKFIVELLTEGRIDDLKIKNPSLATMIDAIASIKPKYLDWAVKQLKLGHKPEDIIPTLRYFDANISRFEQKDINKYDLKSLENTVKDLSTKVSRSQKTRDAKINGAEKLYEDQDDLLLHIKNKEASVCYGAGTKWCITMEDASYFEEYSDKNVVFYFLINKKLPPSDPMHKLAFAVYRARKNQQLKVTAIEVFNAEDDEILLRGGNLGDKQKFIEIVERDASTRPESIRFKLKNKQQVSIDELRKFIEATKDAETTSEDVDAFENGAPENIAVMPAVMYVIHNIEKLGKHQEEFMQTFASIKSAATREIIIHTIEHEAHRDRLSEEDMNEDLRFFVYDTDTDILAQLATIITDKEMISAFMHNEYSNVRFYAAKTALRYKYDDLAFELFKRECESSNVAYRDGLVGGYGIRSMISKYISADYLDKMIDLETEYLLELGGVENMEGNIVAATSDEEHTNVLKKLQARAHNEERDKIIRKISGVTQSPSNIDGKRSRWVNYGHNE